MSGKKQKRKFRFLRRFLRVFFGILLFLFLVLLFIRSSWGQNIIVDYAVNYVSNKTNTKASIDKIFITFDGNLKLEGLFLEDKKQDTLIYSKSLEANLPLIEMINGTAYGVDNLKWTGLRANIVRKDAINGYNFQFLIDAFASSDEAAVVKDTSTTLPKIIIGEINLQDIDVVFNDAVLGIKSSFVIGKLVTAMKTLDLNTMVFDSKQIALVNSDISFIQKPVEAVAAEDSNAPLPKFSSTNIAIKNTKIHFETEENGLLAMGTIDDFAIDKPKIDLTESIFRMDEILLKNSDLTLKTSTKVNQIDEKVNTNVTGFVWPDLAVDIAAINLENNSINYVVNNTKKRKNVFNADAIALSEFTLKASDIFYKDKASGFNISEFQFKEGSGLHLQQLSFNAALSDTRTQVNNLDFRLNRNKINGNINLNYRSIDNLMNAPERTTVQVNIPTIHLFLNELFKFQPSLRNNEILSKISKKPIVGNINANGTLAFVTIDKSKINWGKSTEMSLNGTLQNVTDVDKFQLNTPDFKAVTKRTDIIQFLNEEDLGIKLPEEMALTGTMKGSLKNATANLKLNSSQGIIALKGGFKNEDSIQYNAEINVDNYKLNELLNNEDIGAISLQIKSEGKGKVINHLDASLHATVSDFQLKDYAIKDLKIAGIFENGKGNITSNYKDKNLNINVNATADLDSINTKATVNIDLVGADLAALGIMSQKVKTGMDISVNFNGNLDAYAVDAEVKNGAIVYDNRTYLIGPLKAKGFVDKDTTSVMLTNKMIYLDLESNTDPASFSKALQRHVWSYFYRDVSVADTIAKPVNIKFVGRINQTQLIEDVFLMNLKDVDTINIAVDFNEAKRKLDAKITAPYINYSDNILDSLAFSMNTDADNFNFQLGFKNIKAALFDVPKTIITGKQADNELSLNFSGYDDGETLMNVNTKISGAREELKFSINPENLILNKGKWIIPETNEVVLLNSNKLSFTDFKITKNKQSINITDKLAAINTEHIAVEYDNFKISEVFNYLNPKNEIATGELNGNFVLEDPFSDTGIIANLTISALNILKTDLGKLTLEGKSLGDNKYDFNAKLKEGAIDLDLVGEYFVANDDANLELDLAINEFKMKALNTLSLGELKETSGSFSGDFKVRGTTSKPIYKGTVNFNNAKFNVTKLNTGFTLKNEQLAIDNKGLSMDKFTVLDAKQNALSLSGNIITKNFLNPSFDLQLTADNFRLLNATKEDNELLYGIATFDANAKLTGNLRVPKLSANLTLGSDTDVTYVVPSSYANVENRDEVVVFVNRNNPDAILTQTEEQTAIISGFDISAQLKINKKAAVTIIIDQNTGDNFKVSGKGDLIFTMIPNGRITLTGTYEVAEGHYELSLYNLVNRKFLLAPGGRVSWSGDPFDANLNVSAIYNIKTSASPLMAAQISNEDPSVKNKFKQVLPFNVYLNIKGELLQPKISFDLNMPEDNRGAIGGQVYGRVQQINQREEELNKQVFSLLVLNRFYPDSGSDGSSGGFATIARDNLNDAVSGQLNAFSDQIFGGSGIELDFDLNSYTDYQGNAPTDRTQLGVTAQKRLFNDRLVVRVGSDVDLQGSNPTGEETPLIGNVSLEYKISEDGRYRIKGFRKSEFENVIDGQTVVSGIALIFTQEFNEFREMWAAIFRANKDLEDEKLAEEKAAIEKDEKAKKEDEKEKDKNDEESKNNHKSEQKKN